jgi:methionine sulfoxide reductase heme-binding subunit
MQIATMNKRAQVEAPRAKPASVWAASPPWIKVAIYTLGMTPAAFAFYYAFTGQLGAEPVKALEQALGLVSLRFLVAGLAITPLRKVAGINLVRYRRAIGLVAFFNAFLHVAVYVWFDQDLNLAWIWKDIVKRPYITIGMLSFLILVPLAVTSNNAMIKRLGAAAWQRLHKLVYVAVAAACLHFIMLVKAWPPEPLIYAGLTLALLGWRVWDAYTKPARRPRPV